LTIDRPFGPQVEQQKASIATRATRMSRSRQKGKVSSYASFRRQGIRFVRLAHVSKNRGNSFRCSQKLPASATNRQSDVHSFVEQNFARFTPALTPQPA